MKIVRLNILFLIFHLIGFQVHSQNFVPNPSFEMLNMCPFGYSQIDFALNWDKAYMHSGTSDYFHTCASGSQVGVPYSFFGYQHSHTGSGHAGFYLYSESSEYREYIMCQLTQALKPRKTYRVSFYYSLAEKSAFTVNGIGIYFSSQLPVPPSQNSSVLPFTPQVKMNERVSSDTSSWILVSFEYVAAGGEKYMTIGNFNKNNQCMPLRIRTGSFSYVFVDDISVEPKCISLSGNNKLCIGDSTLLTASGPVLGWANYLYPNVLLSRDSFLWVKPAVSTRYLAYATCDTIPFYLYAYNKPEVNIGSDIVKCETDSVTLKASGKNYDLLLWQNMSADSSFTTQDTGSFYVTVSNTFCSASDTVKISLQPLFSVDLGPDRIGCAGDTILLDAGYPGADYKWQDGADEKVYQVTHTGIYAVEVSRPGYICKAKDTVEIVIHPLPLVDLGLDTNLCEGEIISFNLRSKGYQSIKWQDGSRDSVYIAKTNGLYFVQVSDAFCSAFDTIQLIWHKPVQTDLKESYTACTGDSIRIDFGKYNFKTIQWNDSDISVTRYFKRSGTYVVYYSDSFCTNTDSFTVLLNSMPRFSFPPDTTLCKNDHILLIPGIQDAGYVWHDGSTAASFEVNHPGLYFATLSNVCGQFSDSIWVDDCNCMFYVPNAFTPNGDLLNEGFKPIGCMPEFYHFMIFDRWGEMVFETTDYNESWQGYYKGKPAFDEVFVWMLEYAGSTKARKATKISRGTVTLLR
ncbi:MAG: gliding motility-associated C-terminal domain-containing protein [Bacteroidia bacterium]|nr:gliding motility-associated C-terminal domain-containing protein [Bacteroidia bacterium]